MLGPCKRATQWKSRSHKHLNLWSCIKQHESHESPHQLIAMSSCWEVTLLLSGGGKDKRHLPRIGVQLRCSMYQSQPNFKETFQKKQPSALLNLLDYWIILLDLEPSIKHLSLKKSLAISYFCTSCGISVCNNQQFMSYQSWSWIIISADHLRVQLAEILERAPKASKSHPAMSIPMCWSLPQNTLVYLRLPGKTSRWTWHLPDMWHMPFLLRVCKFLGVSGWLPVTILQD